MKQEIAPGEGDQDPERKGRRADATAGNGKGCGMGPFRPILLGRCPSLRGKPRRIKRATLRNGGALGAVDAGRDPRRQAAELFVDPPRE